MQIKVYVFKDIRFISDLCSITCLFLIALVAAGLKGHCPLVAILYTSLAILIIALLPADLKGHCPLVFGYVFVAGGEVKI